MCIVDKISEKQFLDLKKDVSSILELKQDIVDIKDALLGNKYNPNGLMHRVNTLEEDVELLSKKVDNQHEIRVLKDKFLHMEKTMKFWITLSSNKWVAGLVFFAMYSLTIREVREALFNVIKLIF